LVVSYLVVFNNVFGAGDQKEQLTTPCRDRAVAKYDATMFSKAELYAKANNYEKACNLLSEIIFQDPFNEKAGKLRDACARKIAGDSKDEVKEINEKILKDCDIKIRKAVLEEFPTVVDEAIAQKRFTDAVYWIRFTCSKTEILSPEPALTADAKTILKKLRKSLSELAKAKAYWQMLAVAKKLRTPDDKGNDEEIDKLIATAEKATEAERTKRNEEIEKARGDHIQREAGEFLYWMALPEGYEIGEKSVPYPVIISVTGSGAQYEQELQSWTNSFRGRGYIFVAPVTTSNTNGQGMKFYPKFSGNAIAFDHKGITKLLEDLENLFGADRERFFITGFSGGGTYAYFATMRDIGRWRASAPRNPNYYPQNWAGGPMKQLPKSEIYLPVHIFTSEKDEYKECIRDPKVPGIEPQTKNACAALNGMHFACVLRTEVPGVTHNESPKYYDQIFNWFDKVIAGTQVSGESPNYWPKK